MSRILIVEDYPPLCRALTTLLQRAGYQVALARTAHDMVHMLAQHAYDLVVIDMDISRDGWRVIQALQGAPCHLSVVALLSPQSHRVHDLTALGLHTVLHKPVGRQALLQGIATSLKAQADD